MRNVLDLTHEVVAVPEHAKSPGERKAWLAHDLNEGEWVLEIDQPALREISMIMESIKTNQRPRLQSIPDDWSIPHLRDLFQRVKERLDHDIGFVVIDKMPIDEHPIDDIVTCYWILGQLLGPTVAQKWDGTMIYDVTDTKRRYGYGVRGSATNVELVFHTDNAFGRRVPDYVGLLCRYPARSGGLSRFCSLYSVHERLAHQYPDALSRLYQPMLFDRQAEHENQAPRTSLAPFFSWKDGRLMCRANSSLVRKGYEIAGIDMDHDLVTALAAVDEVTRASDLWIEAPLARGQIQYLNNHELGHYRSHFTDGHDPEKKRHLYRLWHRTDGDRSYDGE